MRFRLREWGTELAGLGVIAVVLVVAATYGGSAGFVAVWVVGFCSVIFGRDVLNAIGGWRYRRRAARLRQ